MHDATIIMKNGTKYCSPIWSFRPKEGWLTILGEPGKDTIKLKLKDITSALTHGQRYFVDGVAKIGDVDELERARKEGWKGD